MAIKKQIYCSLDIEGTGLDSKKDAITEVGAVLFEITPEGELVSGEEFSSLVKPGIPIPPFIQNLTGITEKDVADAPLWEEVLPKFKKFVGAHTIVGQNIPFDLAFLSAAGLSFEQDYIDTKQVAQVFLPQARFYNLEFLMRYLGKPLASHHRALDDAKTTAELLKLIIWSFQSLPSDLQKQAQGILKTAKLSYGHLFRAAKVQRPKFFNLETPLSVPEAKDARQGTLFDFGDQPGKNSPFYKKIHALFDKPAEGRETIFINAGATADYNGLIGDFASALAENEEKIVISAQSLGQIEGKRLDDWLVVGNPFFKLCPVRLKELLEQKIVRPAALTEFLVKTLIFSRAGGGDLQSLPMFGDDYNYRRMVCADFEFCQFHAKDFSCPLHETLKNLKIRKKVLTTHDAWVGFSKVFPEADFTGGIFFDPSALENVAEANLMKVLSHKRLRFLATALHNPADASGFLKNVSPQLSGIFSKSLNDLDLHFGLWNIELEKSYPASTQIVCDADFRVSETFAKISDSAGHLAGVLNTLCEAAVKLCDSSAAEYVYSELRAAADQLSEFIFSPRPGRVYWFDSFAGSLKLKSQDRVAGMAGGDNFSRLVLVGSLKSASARNYYQRIFGLGEEEFIDLHPKQQPLLLGFAAGIPGKDTPHSQKILLELLGKILPRLQGRTVVLANSQKNLDHFYEPLSRFSLKERLLVQRYTGHHWKNLESYNADASAIWFMTVRNFLSNVRDLPPTCNLLVLRIPYDTPGVFSAFYDPDDIFEEFILPRTAIRLVDLARRAFARAAAHGSSALCRLIFFDPRISEDYNRSLLGAIESEFDCETFDFEPDDWERALLD